MVSRKIALFFRIPSTLHEPQIRKSLTISRFHRKTRAYTEVLPPVKKAKKFIGNIWKVECVDNCTYFVLVEC